MSCDVGEATEGLENELWRRWSDRKLGEWPPKTVCLWNKKLIHVLPIVYELPLGLHQLHKMILDTRPSCTCRPPQWSQGNVIPSHLAGPGLIPGRVSFPGCGFLQSFPSTVRQMTGKLRCHHSPDINGHQTLLFRAVPIDFTISSLHFVASFCCRLA